MIPEAVLEAYQISNPTQVERVSGTKNRNYRVVDERSGLALFIRKRHPDYSGSEWLAFDHAAINHIRANRAPVLSPIRVVGGSGAGDTWVTYGTDLYEAYPYVSGRTFEQNSEGDIESVARGLAVTHMAGVGFERTFQKGDPRGEMGPDRLLRVCRRLRSEGGDLDSVLYDYERELAVTAEGLTDDRYHRLEKRLTHGDVHPGNIIMSARDPQQRERHSELLFVDYDWIGLHPVIYDLAYALLFVCCDRTSPLRPDDIWSLSQPFSINETKIGRFLETYCNTMDDRGERRGPLGPEFASDLVLQMRLSWIHCRVDGARKVAVERRKEFLAREVSGTLSSLVALAL